MGLRWRHKPEEISHHPGRFYSYAACAISEGPGESPMRLWWCQNEADGVIRDSLFYGERAGGIERPMTGTRVLSAGPPGMWDSFHVCDPSVIAGNFRRGGERYRYALFYLGNDVDASHHNQIGVAFGNEPQGPWTRRDRPLIPHNDKNAWGVGQPSAISLDQKGRVLLFYTCGDRAGTRVLLREVDLRDANAPLLAPPAALTSSGLTGTDSRPDWFNNADFALSADGKRLYCVREQHPYPGDPPGYIGASLQIASLPLDEARRGSGRWTVEGAITPDVTGFARNHNGGFVRTSFGTLPTESVVQIVFASSGAGLQFHGSVPEWTYDLWLLTGERT